MSKTALFYQYRDASNYKAYGCVALAGRVPPDIESRIRATLIDGLWFVAEQVRIPTLRHQLFIYSNGPTTDDHGWHEFVRVGDLPKDYAPEAVMNARDMLAAFENVQGRWEDLLAPV